VSISIVASIVVGIIYCKRHGRCCFKAPNIVSNDHTTIVVANPAFPSHGGFAGPGPQITAAQAPPPPPYALPPSMYAQPPQSYAQPPLLFAPPPPPYAQSPPVPFAHSGFAPKAAV
jgi:hypothetical protein